MDFSILQPFISLMCFTIYLLYLYLKQLSRTYETAILNIKYSNLYSVIDTTTCSTDHKIILIWFPKQIVCEQNLKCEGLIFRDSAPGGIAPPSFACYVRRQFTKAAIPAFLLQRYLLTIF